MKMISVIFLSTTITEESKMETKLISKNEARRFLINYHNFNGSQNYSGVEGVLRYFSRVRSIQYDPLNVVGRNADLVLQSKVANYKPELLHQLLYSEHILVDGVDKEMCIYLSDDFPKFERIRAAKGLSLKNTLGHRGQLEALNLLDEVRDFIRKHGAISTKDISIGESQENRWGHKKLSSAALDYLYTIGELCVVDKKGTQKRYDFTSNVLPLQFNQTDPWKDEDEFMRWYVQRRIGSVGMIWDKNGGAWQGHYISDKKKREQTLNYLLEEGEIVAFQIEDIKAPFFMNKKDESLFADTNTPKLVKFLAPLDNILWDREMVKQLFHFDYRWEVYTPVEKRNYGYYVLPVLYGDQLIARFEPSKLTKNSPFQIKHWWWEPQVEITEDLLHAITTAISEFCKYLDAECSNDYTEIILKDL